MQKGTIMDEFLNDVDASQEPDVEVQNAEPSEVDSSAEPETVAEPTKPQSADDNAKFAAARRAAEAEKNAIKAQNDRLLQALGQFGWTGTPDEIADALMAQTQGISVEEATAQRQAAEAEAAKFDGLQAQLEVFRPLAIQKLMADDLAKVQTVNPEVKSLDELGTDFFAYMKMLRSDPNIDKELIPVLAYDALQAKKARDTKPIPQNIGAVNSSSSKEKDFYTPEEVDKLTSKDYDNPKIMERVRQSMLKWK